MEKTSLKKENRLSYKSVERYVRRYAENCRYSFHKMLSL